MKKAILAVLILLTTTARAGAQVDSCLCTWGAADSNGWWNPDTVKADTCKYKAGFPASEQYTYSKWYEVIFQYAVIKLDSVKPDSILWVPWTAIDTAYPTLRNICRQLDSEYGGILFRKSNPGIGDTSIGTYNEFVLWLNHYAPVDSIRYPFNEDSIARVYYDQPVPAIYSVSADTLAARINLIYTDPEHVYIQGVETRFSYSIFDQIGRTIVSNELEPGELIDLSSLRSGLYFLRTEGESACCFKIFH